MPWGTPEKRREYWRRYSRRPEVRKRRLVANKKYRDSHKEKRSAWDRRYRQEHPEAVLSGSSYREMVVNLLLERDGDLCGICGGQFDLEHVEIDHIVPRVNGGGHGAPNLRLTHEACNQSRLRR